MELAELSVKLSADLAEFERSMNAADARIESMTRDLPAVRVNADTSGVEQGLAAVDRQIHDMSGAVQIDSDTVLFEQALAEINRELQSLGGDPIPIPINADVAELEQHLAELQNRIASFDWTATIDADTSGIDRSLTAVDQSMDRFREKVIDVSGIAEAQETTAASAVSSIDAQIAALDRQIEAEADLARHHERIIELERQWQAQQAATAAASTPKLDNAAAQAQGREFALSLAAGLEQQFKFDMARIKEDQLRGILTPEEAEQAGRQAGLAFNEGIQSTLDQARGRGAFGGEQGTAAYTKIAGSLKDVDAAAKGATLNVGRLNPTIASLAARAAGAHPVTGQLANVLGSFAIGSALTVGVLAGLAAVGFAWNKWTHDAREAAKAAKDAIDEVERLARANMVGSVQSTAITEAQSEMTRLRALIDEAKRPRSMAEIETGVSAPSEAAIAKLQAQYDRYSEIVEKAETQTSDAIDGANERNQQAYDSNLAALIAANKATEEERARARQRIAEHNAKLEELAKGPQTDETRAERARLAASAGQLTSALTRQPKAVQIPEFDKLMRQLREQEVGFAQSERAAYEYSLTLNKGLTPAQRSLVLAQFDATAAAEAQRQADDDAAKATERFQERLADLNATIEIEHLRLTQGVEAARRYELAQEGITGAIADEIIARERRNRSLDEEAEAREAAADAAADAVERAAERQQQQLDAVAESMAGSVGDAFTDWITGAEEFEEAFTRMINSMIRDIIRLAVQKALVDPLVRIFGGIIGGFVGGPAGAVALPGNVYGVSAPASAVPAVSSVSAVPAAGLSLEVNVPPAQDPITLVRDAQWQKALRESLRVARSQGFN